MTEKRNRAVPPQVLGEGPPPEEKLRSLIVDPEAEGGSDAGDKLMAEILRQRAALEEQMAEIERIVGAKPGRTRDNRDSVSLDVGPTQQRARFKARSD